MKLQNMLAATAVASALIAPPAGALAGGILPYLYATAYCSYRQNGLSKDDAAKLAYRNAYSSAATAIMVTFEGRQVRSDHYEASTLVSQYCPGL